jgi:AraC-like DNA-binding protein
MIAYFEYKPSRPLCPFIECFWTMKSHSKFFKRREVIIPGGRAEIFFTNDTAVNWIDSKQPNVSHSHTGSHVLGPRNRPFYVEMAGAVSLVGVRFRHGGLAPFTAIPVDLLLNQIISLDQIFDKKVNSLAGQLLENDNAHRQISLIEKFLFGVIESDSQTCKTIQLIAAVKNQQFTSIDTLSKSTGIHYKKLERTFSRFTGYNPKNFSRVVRFYQALRQMQATPASLTHIGLNNGYYDQAHFIRDFKAFTGNSPTRFNDDTPVIANLLLRSAYV